jgi:hypothetical protein
MYHPWRSLRDHFADWNLRWAPMHDRVGLTTYATKTITLHPDLDQAQRRSTLAHELEHVRRGPCAEHLWPREEVIVEAIAARKLVGIRELGEALAWARDFDEAAQELWVDRSIIDARLAHLHPSERHYLRRRLREDGAL